MEVLYSTDNKNRLIEILTEELPSLRAKIGITQDELCNIVGISRQTYSSIENKKKKMSWNTFLALIMLYTNNEKTSTIINKIGAFPDDLQKVLNVNNR